MSDNEQQVPRPLLVGLIVAVVAVAAMAVIPRLTNHGHSAATASVSVSGTNSFGAVTFQGGTDVPTMTSSEASVDPRAQESANRAALTDVVNTWGVFDVANDADGNNWESTVCDLPEASGDFCNQSTSQFSQIWGGALQQGVSVTHAMIKHIQKVSSHDGTDVYNVTIEQTVEDPGGDTGLSGTTETTWAFQVTENDGSPLVTAFGQPGELK